MTHWNRRRIPSGLLITKGHSVLTENAVESRFAFGNGFLGMRATRSISRDPTCQLTLDGRPLLMARGREPLRTAHA